VGNEIYQALTMEWREGGEEEKDGEGEGEKEEEEEKGFSSS